MTQERLLHLRIKGYPMLQHMKINMSHNSRKRGTSEVDTGQ